MCAKCHAAGRIAASAGAEVLPWRYRPPRCGSSHGEFEEIGHAFRWNRTPQDPGSCAPPLCRSAVLHADTVPVGGGPLAWMRGAECRGQRQYIRCHRRSLSPGLFVVGFAHCMYSRTLHGPVYQTPGPLRTVRESLLPLSALPSMRLNRLCCSHSPCPIAPPSLPAADAALLPVRGGRRERACGCSVSRQPCWQGWQRIPGWWREGLAFLPAEQGSSEIAVQGIKGSAGLPLWPHGRCDPG